MQLARSNPNNSLVQHRGQPSTHDISLGLSLFQALKSRQSNIRIPSYDKSAFDGEGDRCSEKDWELVNAEGAKPVDVIVFEGWCVGFRALDSDALIEKWQEARAQEEQGNGHGQLRYCRLQDVEHINVALRGYDVLTKYVLLIADVGCKDVFG